VINLADAPAIGAPREATFIRLEPDGVTWPDTGVNVQVMQPGEPNGRYHSEPVVDVNTMATRPGVGLPRRPDPDRGVSGLNGTVHCQQKFVTHRVEIDCVPQPHRERGDDRFGVVAGTVEAPVHETLHP
jgi:hypothetical protein